MSAPKKLQPARVATALFVALALCLGIMLADRAALRAHAGPKRENARAEKLSRKLRDRVRGGDRNKRVKVIIDTEAAWDAGLEVELTGRLAKLGPKLRHLKSRAVELRAQDVERLAENPAVSFIAPDEEIEALGHVTQTSGVDAAATMTGTSSKYDGTGVGIAVLDSGVDPNHVAFKDAAGVSRIVFNKDFTGEGRTDDPNGHGTHVAGIAAGNGSVSAGAYQGVAPNAKIVNLRVLNGQGRGTTSGLLAALDWVLVNRANATYNIKVVNLSLGTHAVSSYLNDPVCKAVRALVDAGVVVVAAAGNEGKDALGNKVYGRIHSPGTEPSAITVGASNTFQTNARNDDQVATFSSRGPTRGYWTDASGVKHYDNLIKPDLVAPGNKIIAPQSPVNALLAANPLLGTTVSLVTNQKYMTMSGTSMATPVVAGTAALIKQAAPGLTPNLVKVALMYTAQPLAGFNNFEQGAGQLNLEGAMRLAKLFRADLPASTALGAQLLCAGCAAPTTTTTIASFQFNWSQAVILDRAFATGPNLILKYQKVYGLGVMLTDGTVESGGVLLSDNTQLSTGITLSESIITSNGTALDAGSIFASTGVLVADGVLLSDGVMLSDGVLLSDGVMLADGIILGDD